MTRKAKAGVVAAGCVRLPDTSHVTLEEMIFNEVSAFLREHDIDPGRLDEVAMASSDGLDGRAISMMVTAGSLPTHGRYSINASSSGEHALQLAVMAVMAGRAEMALAVCWSKASEADVEAVLRLTSEPFYTRPVVAPALTFDAMQAAAYASRTGVTDRAAAEHVVAALQSADGSSEITVDDVTSSPYVSWPLRQGHVPPMRDGVACVVVGSESTMRERQSARTVWIDGMGWGQDSSWMGSRDLTRLQVLTEASAMALRHADVSAVDEFDVVEVAARNPYLEMMVREALGVQPGTNERINRHGGLYRGDLGFAAGLERVVEVVDGLIESTSDQPTRGLAHTTSGMAAQSHSVFALSASSL